MALVVTVVLVLVMTVLVAKSVVFVGVGVVGSGIGSSDVVAIALHGGRSLFWHWWLWRVYTGRQRWWLHASCMVQLRREWRWCCSGVEAPQWWRYQVVSGSVQRIAEVYVYEWQLIVHVSS